MTIGIDIRVLMNPIRTGVAEYTFELLDALFRADRTNQYFLFYNSHGDVSPYIPAWNFPNVHVVSTRLPNKLFNASLGMFKRPRVDALEIRNLKLEISHLDYFFSPNLNFIALSPKTKHILTIHDLSFELFPDCYTWKQRLWHRAVAPKKQCERAHLILAPSENTKRNVVAWYGISEEKVRVIRPGLNDEFGIMNDELRMRAVRHKYNLPEKFMLFLGTIEPRKNITGVVEAYKQCRMQNAECRIDNYELVIAGPKGWKYGDVMRRIEKTPGVRYIGYVDAPDKPALYRLASLFVYPSLYEGFGFPVLEAMSMGTPVITSNRSSLPEITGSAAYLVNPYFIHEIADGMRLLLFNEQARQWHIAQGLERSREFWWEQTVREFLELLAASL